MFLLIFILFVFFIFSIFYNFLFPIFYSTSRTARPHPHPLELARAGSNSGPGPLLGSEAAARSGARCSIQIIKTYNSEKEHIKTIKRRISKNRIELCGTEIRQSNDCLYSKLSYLHQQVDAIERLKNRKVVISGNHVVTCYSCSKSELKRISKIIN